MITEPRQPDRLLAATVGNLLFSENLLRWRHHKIGVLQAYLVEATHSFQVETRIHVWHPDLILADEDSGRIHDHRFWLTSHVLLGAMHDSEIKLIPRGTFAGDVEKFGGLYEVWCIQNARKAAEDGQHWVKKESSAQPEHYFIEEIPHVYSMGSTYSYPPRQFHRSDVKELTVTVCTKKTQSDIPARLLARVGAEPKHAFDPTPKHGKLSEAHERLLQEAGSRLMQIASDPS